MKKDGKLAWSVAVVACVIQTIIFGQVLCFGIYFVTLLDYFKCHKSEVATIGAMTYGMMCLTGPFAATLSKMFGYRIVCMAGGLTASVGLLLSYFAPNVQTLCFSFGFVGGFGFGLSFTPTVGVLGEYFDRWKYFATSIVSVGQAAGSFLFSPIFLRLIEHYGWRGSMLINSGLVLQIVVLGTILKSRSPPQPFQMPCSCKGNAGGLIRNPKFSLLCFDCFVYGSSVYMTFVMINNYVMTKNISQSDSVLLVSCIGLCNILGRILSSMIGHCSCTNRMAFFACLTALLGVSLLGLTFCWEFIGFAMCAGLFGFAFGSRQSQLPGVLADTFGQDQMLSAFGFMLLAIGVGGISYPALSGFLAEKINIDVPFYIAGGLCIFIGLLSLFLSVFVLPKDVESPISLPPIEAIGGEGPISSPRQFAETVLPQYISMDELSLYVSLFNDFPYIDETSRSTYRSQLSGRRRLFTLPHSIGSGSINV